MKRINIRAVTFISILTALMLSISLLAGAQEKPNTTTGNQSTQSDKTTKQTKTNQTTGTQKDKAPASDMQHQHDQMTPAGGGKAGTMTATLVDAEAKAQKKEATVQVAVKGVKIVDPASVNEQPKAGQGHLHYRVDDGPIIATTSTKLSFHGLSSGEHRIMVMLAANDHSPLGPEQNLTVTIP